MKNLLLLTLILLSPNVNSQIYTIQVELMPRENPGMFVEDSVFTRHARYPSYSKIIQSDAVVKDALLQVKSPDKNRVQYTEIKKNLLVELHAEGICLITFKTKYKEFGLQFMNALTKVSLVEDQALRYTFYDDSLVFYEKKADQLVDKIVMQSKTSSETKNLLSYLNVYVGMKYFTMLKAVLPDDRFDQDLYAENRVDLDLEIVNDISGLIFPEIVERDGHVKVRIAAKSLENDYLKSRDRQVFFRIQAMKILPRYLYLPAKVVE